MSVSWWKRLRPPSNSARRELGARSERLASQFLAAHGYVIEARNVRYSVGEIDLVAREGAALCFVEIRSVSSTQWGGGLATITDRKRRHMIRAAQCYLQRRPAIPEHVRFDVLAVTWEGPHPPSFELIQDAFPAD